MEDLAAHLPSGALNDIIRESPRQAANQVPLAPVQSRHSFTEPRSPISGNPPLGPDEYEVPGQPQRAGWCK